MQNSVKPFLYGLIGGATVLAGNILYNKITTKTAKKGSDTPDVSDDDDLDFEIFDSNHGDYDPEDAAEFFGEEQTPPKPDIDMNALQQIRNDAFNSGYNAGLHVANNREYNRGYEEGVRYGYGIARADAAKDIDEAFEEGKIEGLNTNAPDLPDTASEPPIELEEVIKSNNFKLAYKPESKEVEADKDEDVQHTLATAIVNYCCKDSDDPVIKAGIGCAIRAMLYRMGLPRTEKKAGIDNTKLALIAVRAKLNELHCEYEAVEKYIRQYSQKRNCNKTLYEKSMDELRTLKNLSENHRDHFFKYAEYQIDDYLNRGHQTNETDDNSNTTPSEKQDDAAPAKE